MKLVVGLGNPGKKYKNTKHNVGFMSLDFYANKVNATFKKDNKFSGEWLKTGGLILLKPHTFMNLSGDSIQKMMRFYDIDVEDILVIYDDLSLPFGKLRLREQGSAGGHNGIKSVIQHVKTNEFKRIKFGIDRNDLLDTKDYVLSNFSKKELKEMDDKLNIICNIIDDFKQGNEFVKIMTKYN